MQFTTIVKCWRVKLRKYYVDETEGKWQNIFEQICRLALPQPAFEPKQNKKYKGPHIIFKIYN